MAYKTTQRVSTPNLKLFGPLKTELRVKEVEEFSIQLRYMGKWAGSFAHQHGCLNIHVWRFSKLKTGLRTAVTFAFIGIST